MANKVTLTIAGEDKASKVFDDVGSAADDMADDVRDASSSFDDIGDAAGDVDTKAMGFRDTITGVQDGLTGLSDLKNGNIVDGMFGIATGVGDLASGIENLLAPLAGQVTSWITGHASMATAAVTSAATQVASWVTLGVQSMLNAAKVAAAWLISMGPIILVIAAVAGLVYLIWKYWDEIKAVISAGWEWVKENTKAAWDWIWEKINDAVTWIVDTVSGIHTAITDTFDQAVEGAIGFITDLKDDTVNLFWDIIDGIEEVLGFVYDILVSPFEDAFDGILDAWNNTVGGKGFTVPSWIPGVGGQSFTIPKFHNGGVFDSGNGEGVALLRDGETVLTPGQMNLLSSARNSSSNSFVLKSDGSSLSDIIIEIIQKYVRIEGGDVQGALS